MDKLTLQSPFDMHLHLRQSDMLSLVSPLTAKFFAGAVVMPNLMPPITTIEQIEAYSQEIINTSSVSDFTPFMSIFLKEYTKEFWLRIKDKILIAKLYPAGVTTNSEGGASSIDTLYPQFEILQELGIILSIHCETAGDAYNREREFIPILENICRNFPKLKIIFEHISTQEGIETVAKYSNLYATITAHHLYLNSSDLLGEKFKPHLFCKPLLQSKKDQEAIIKYAISADKKVCFGSDSAPHLKSAKESLDIPAGIFSAPIALCVLAEIFEKHNALDKLQSFVCDNAVNIYKIKKTSKIVELVKYDFVVPSEYSNDSLSVVPMLAGKKLSWKIA